MNITHVLVAMDREPIVPFGRHHRQPERQDDESGGPRGYDAGKKIRGRKRHALVDTERRALIVEPHRADI